MAHIIVQVNGKKSENSVRVLPATASYVHLKRWKNEYPFEDLKNDDYVFPSKTRGKHQRQFLNFLYTRICKRAGIRHINPYLMRHRRLTSVYEKTKDLLLTSKFGGHSLKVSSDFYQHSSANDIKDMIMEKVYAVKEPTIEEKDEIKKMKRELEEINKKLKFVEELKNFEIETLKDPKKYLVKN